MKRTLANLSALPKLKVDALKAALSGNTVFTSAPESGPVWAVLDVLNQLSQELGLNDILGNTRMAKLMKFLIFARLAHNGSRLSAVRWAEDHCVSEILGLSYFNEDDLYEALDFAAAQQEEIEKKLYARYLKKRGAPPVLVLYDVTSSYFEGECNELAQYGYNRDGKKGKKQIVIGLLTDEGGEPLSVTVFKGNTSDPSTVESQIEKLLKRFSITEVVLVGDRGMIKSKGKSALHAVKFKYISAITDAQVCKLMKENIIQPDMFDTTVVEVEQGDKRFILKKDEQTYKKEQHRRENKLTRLQKLVDERNKFVGQSKTAEPLIGLKKLTQWTQKYKISSFVKLSLKDNSTVIIEIDDLGKKENGLLDGCYVIETDISKDKMTTQVIHDRYRDLQKVERDFRTLKTGLLELRPIFLRKKERTEGHVFLSMLCLKLTREFESRIKSTFQTTNENPYAITLTDALTSLSRITVLNCKTADQTIRMLPRPDPRQKEILAALKIKLTPPSQKAK